MTALKKTAASRRVLDWAASNAALLLALGLMTGEAWKGSPAAAQALRPNIIHIFADDLGKATLGVYGQNARVSQDLPAIRTPNLDELATAGMTFQRAYAATLCSPSRGMLMTGFHQGHGHNDRNTQSFRAADITVAQLLQAADYSTGIFGKWGYGGSAGQNPNGVAEEFNLGYNPSITNVTTLPTSKGYDEFLGELNHSRAHLYFPSSLWTTDPTGNPQTAGISEKFLGNQDPLDPNHNLQQTYSHDVIAARSEQFVTAHYNDAKPFYMQVNYTIPHNDLEAIQYVPNWFGAYDGVDTSTWTEKEKYYAAMITRMDASVGSLMNRLEDPNNDGNSEDSIADNTIILFSSDNGPTDADFSVAGLDHFGINDTLRGGKRDLWEGGINVPLLVRWDGHIAANSSSQHATDLADFLPTAAELAGVATPVGIDGVSILPTLAGTVGQRDRGYLIFEHHDGDGPDADAREADWTVVRGNQKLIRFRNGDYELYDLSSDPGESNPLNLTSPVNAALRAELELIAAAEGVNRADSYANQFQTWIGSNGETLIDGSNWSGSTTGAPTDSWSAVIANQAGSASIVRTGGNVGTLGLEIRGGSGPQTVRVDPADVLSGRNEVRIGNQARIHLDGAELSSNRWIDISAQGALTGLGTVSGHVFNHGRLAPGLPGDLPAPDLEGDDDVDTGIVTAVEFDFTGVQDDAPLTNTSVLNENMRLVGGFNFGPGLAPRGAVNAGNEFNVVGFLNQNQVPSSLGAAIAAEDYLTFTVAPQPGIAMTLNTVTVNLWRNGTGAAEEYAILASLDGFQSGQEIGSISVSDFGIANQHQLVGQAAARPATTDPVEIRIYGWDANGNSGNTHFNAVSMTASFVSVPHEPMSPHGLLALSGDFDQLATGVLALDLAGTDNSDPQTAEFDSLVIEGSAHLGGLLEISLADSGGGNFTPQLGDSFEIIQAESLEGQFSSLHLPELPTGLDWDIVYTNQTVTLVVEVASSGDFNRDGFVDAADYVVWRKSDLFAAGYNYWRTNFGATISGRVGDTSSRGSTVPEATSVTQLALLAAFALLYHRPGMVLLLFRA
jgi:arylsulfatase A-like enzyme